MNRDEFMAQLARLLVELPENERMEAIRYYNDYFDEAGPENEAKVIQELGSPGRVAASIKANMQENAGQEHAGRETGSQEYSYGSQEQGEFTENGYRENHGSWSQSSGVNGNQNYSMEVRKPRSAGKWALLIIVLVFASPVIFGLGGGLLGGILGLLGGAFGLLIGCLAGGLGGAIGGIALIVKGVVNIFTEPAMGFAGMGGGLLAIAIGLLLLVLFMWICFQLLPRLFRAVTNFLSRILNKRKGGAES